MRNGDKALKLLYSEKSTRGWSPSRPTCCGYSGFSGRAVYDAMHSSVAGYFPSYCLSAGIQLVALSGSEMRPFTNRDSKYVPSTVHP